MAKSNPKGNKGKPPSRPIKVPKPIPKALLHPSDAKHHVILHQHQERLLQKINSGEASREDHQLFSNIRDRLNQHYVNSGLNTQVRKDQDQ